MKSLLRNPFTLLIHFALTIILVGAIVTHFFGIQGTVTMNERGSPVKRFEKTPGPGEGRFPFTVSLKGREIIFYPGTTTPMDFKSVLAFSCCGDKTVAMNRVAEVSGWRFYQSGMGNDSSTLSISYDPWGIGITYTGYALLGLGMIGFFFQKRTLWKSFFKNRGLMVVFFLIVTFSATASDDVRLSTMQRPLAHNFGKIYVYWNGRICPLQTMAYDVTAKLYDSRQYRNLTPEQVLAGWLFYYDEWLRDYDVSHSGMFTGKALKKEEERRNLINWLGSGGAFRIYPYKTAGGDMEWLSLTERRPSKMDFEQWKFMVEMMPSIKSELMLGRNIEANNLVSMLIDGQRKYAGNEFLPSESKFCAEIFYNNYIRLWPVGLFTTFIALYSIFLFLKEHDCGSRFLIVRLTSILICVVIGGILILRGWISGHWPLANGCETMLFMALAASLGSIFALSGLIRGSLLLVTSISLFIASMSGKSPQIENLMPVLDSPLLSIHVMLVMLSYVLFLFMAILSGVGLIKKGSLCDRLALVNRRVLVPAVFLLAAGIFIGAVWANQSWGRYWGWDPKETCALITMLIYSLPLHSSSLKIFRKSKVVNIYLLLAVLSVAFTYFGANYFLPGLHSYV